MTSIAARIGAYQMNADTIMKANAFVQAARAILCSHTRAEARDFLRLVHAHDRAAELLERSAVQPGSTTDSTWAAPLAVSQLSDAFAETLRNASAFDAVLAAGGFMRVPPIATVAITTLAPPAYLVGEQAPKPASLMNFSSASVSMAKVASYVVLSDELLRSAGPGPINLLSRELKGAIGQSTDAYLIAQLTAGLTAIPSTAGSAALAIRADLRDLLDAVSFGANAALYYITTPQIAKRLSVVGDSAGGRMFPGLSPTGGVLDNVPLLVSDAAVAGSLLLFDATQVAVAAGPIELDRSTTASISAETAPDSPPISGSSYINLFQQNLAALRAERFLGISRLRSTAAAILSGVSGIGNSPS
jgi:HK97 family phage major capsid protein